MPRALAVRALALVALDRSDEAITALGDALRAAPGKHVLWRERGDLLLAAGRAAEAASNYEAALNAAPGDFDLLSRRAHAWTAIRRFDLALADCDAILAAQPKSASAHFSRANVLDELSRHAEAVEAYDRALALRPDDVKALNNRSVALVLLARYAEAAEGLERLLAIAPDSLFAFGGLAHAKMNACDWRGRAEIEAGLRTHILERKSEIHPGTLLGYLDDPALQLACAQHYVAHNAPPQNEYRGVSYTHEKLRIAYLSADYHNHATARLAVELFERHDRAAFQVEAVSFGADDQSPIRARCIAAFAAFHEAGMRSDEEIAALLAQRQIDIAIDVKGFTTGARAGVFARRPAPVQVNYLAFPGTMGAAYMDYIIADATVAPMGMQGAFTEKIVHLPASYQPNDSTRAAPACTLSRADAGLPEAGVVFCCFNNSFKITPAFFDVWMRLLGAVDGSVLWLLQDSSEAVANLRREAAARGVDPARLVFASRVSPDEHLARHRLADLFLDTLPYGAHTTASDALWMGLPVVTRLGEAFAGRVCASLCRAAGLGDLVAEDLAGYARLALALARDPARRAALSAKLERDRVTLPLFDTERYTRALERAYAIMVQRQRSGQAPAPFAVD
jgi:predicted O-linked N-acetylglucosamine transferase (SPINDLY family)